MSTPAASGIRAPSGVLQGTPHNGGAPRWALAFRGIFGFGAQMGGTPGPPSGAPLAVSAALESVLRTAQSGPIGH